MLDLLDGALPAGQTQVFGEVDRSHAAACQELANGIPLMQHMAGRKGLGHEFLTREGRMGGVAAARAASLLAAPARFRILIILSGWRHG